MNLKSFYLLGLLTAAEAAPRHREDLALVKRGPCERGQIFVYSTESRHLCVGPFVAAGLVVILGGVFAPPIIASFKKGCTPNDGLVSPPSVPAVSAAINEFIALPNRTANNNLTNIDGFAASNLTANSTFLIFNSTTNSTLNGTTPLSAANLTNALTLTPRTLKSDLKPRNTRRDANSHPNAHTVIGRIPMRGQHKNARRDVEIDLEFSWTARGRNECSTKMSADDIGALVNDHAMPWLVQRQASCAVFEMGNSGTFHGTLKVAACDHSVCYGTCWS